MLISLIKPANIKFLFTFEPFFFGALSFGFVWFLADLTVKHFKMYIAACTMLVKQTPWHSTC